jgi:hypothetical protein
MMVVVVAVYINIHKDGERIVLIRRALLVNTNTVQT